MLPDATAITVHNLWFSYPGGNGTELPVFRGLTFCAPFSETVGVVGRNGTGKTTLISLLRGTLIPQRGQIRVSGLVVCDGQRVKTTGSAPVIWQRPDAGLAPTMTVLENFVLATTCRASPFRWAHNKIRFDKCRRVLESAEMGLETKLQEQARFLSSGQQQALSVLLALQSDHPVLLMDEPTASLDPVGAKRILDLAISETMKKEGTVVLVSHRLRDIVERCDRVIVLNNKGISHDLLMKPSRISEADLTKLLVSEAENEGPDCLVG